MPNHDRAPQKTSTSSDNVGHSADGSEEAIARATYPISLALAQRLDLATSKDANRSLQVRKETPLQALTNLLDNAIHALDQWYFASPPGVRKALAHRTCIRIETFQGPEYSSITITDLGIGMTRADLINTLGVGRPLPPPPSASPPTYSTKKSPVQRSNSNASRRSNVSVGPNLGGISRGSGRSSASVTRRLSKLSISSRSTWSGSFVSDDDSEVCEEGDATILSCQTRDLGGFYAALCTLAVGVTVGTKSAQDDYYEFHVGHIPPCQSERHASQTGSTPSFSWKEFVLLRPSADGSIVPSPSERPSLGLLCGDSGTSVTLYLQDSQTQLADPQVLLALVTKALETTQYTYAIAGLIDPTEEAALLEASMQEAEILKGALETRELEGTVSGDLTSLGSKAIPKDDSTTMSMRAKFIPVRLSLEERKLLRLVEAAMNCCDYTTQVDYNTLKSGKISPTRRILQQVKGVMGVFRGLITACDAKAGRKLAEEKGDVDYEEYLPLLQRLLEIARRHKICNPEKMRTEYGQLIYLWQDAIQLQQEGYLEAYFSSTNSLQDAPMKTVYSFLEERDGLALLDDPHIHLATQEVLATDSKSRLQLDKEIKRKEKAVKLLKARFETKLLSRDDIHLCLYSICDNDSFLNSNRVPIDKAIEFLTKEFHPKHIQPNFSLAIVQGEDGARLDHSHEKQYYFALQSLTLWREIVHDMYRLWAMAEMDLLNPSIRYNLKDTGQGMQRLQQSPRTYHAMQDILKRVQKKVQHWVGSSVIHLGDHNVPNALSFIDKYTQVSRILGPILTCLENMERLCDEDYALQDLIEDGFGGLDKVKKEIMYDFFRSAFDGSGADNFYDAGSCIDGRLTSAWNWCSQLPTKPYYYMFKLTGFSGFDGEFQ